MTEKEAEAVLKLHLEKTGGSAPISIQDTAEVLRLPQEEVAALLRQVRAGNTEAASRAVRGMRRMKKRDMILALIAAAVIAIGALAVFGIGFTLSREGIERTNKAFFVKIGGQTKEIKMRVQPEHAGSRPNLSDAVFQMAEEAIADSRGSENAAQSFAEEQAIAGMRKGVWTGPGIREVEVEVFPATSFETRGKARLPVYLGKDPRGLGLAMAERKKRVSGALEMLASRARLRLPQ